MLSVVAVAVAVAVAVVMLMYFVVDNDVMESLHFVAVADNYYC